MNVPPSQLQIHEQSTILERFWNLDPSLWSEQEEVKKSISKRLGWIGVIETMSQSRAELEEFAEEIRLAGFEEVVLLGMGGSSLAPYMFQRIFGPAAGFPSMTVLDTTDPDEIEKTAYRINLEKTLFIVASKSGGTIEPNTQYRFFRHLLETADLNFKEHFAAITDKGTILHDLALGQGFRKVFLNPSDIGGRYSAISLFGLVPAALLGMDLDRLLAEVEKMIDSCRKGSSFHDNPGASLGSFLAEMALTGRDKLTLFCHDRLTAFGLWVEQLVAESTGKQSTGVIPVVGEHAGLIENYGNDRFFVALKLAGQSSILDHTVARLQRSGLPLHEIELHDPYEIGAECFRWEMATALCGHFLSINPFDEPNVTESKNNTFRILSDFQNKKKMPVEFSGTGEQNILFRCGGGLAQTGSFQEAINILISGLSPNSYLSFLAYLPYQEEIEDGFQAMRSRIRDKMKCATVFGFGPRYLHSTGQEHKGGPASGSFIMVTRESGKSKPIPAYGFSFRDLQFAQALGDFQSLAARGLPVLHVHLPEDYSKGLEILKKAVEKELG